MGCSVQENSVRARPTSTVSIQPRAHGINWKTTSRATPALVHSQSMALAVLANMGSGTVSPGCAFFHCTNITTMMAAQNQEPTTSRVAPR